MRPQQEPYESRGPYSEIDPPEQAVDVSLAPTSTAMDDSAKTGTGAEPGPAPGNDADEFAAIRRRRTRHPVLALGAAVLALFLVLKTRADLTYFMSPRTAADLGDARTLVSTDRGRAVLAEGTNRLVRVQGTPDRESALQVDTKGSWTFTQFFKILGTDGRLFVHRRENPVPAARAENDVFVGRLLRFKDLSFEDAIRAYFAGHVSATHFFPTEAIHGLAAAHSAQPAAVRDLAGDTVTLGPNDILALDLRRPGEIEVALPIARFTKAEDARTALEASIAKSRNSDGNSDGSSGARVVGPGKPASERHTFVVAVSAAARDQVMDAIGDIDQHVGVKDVRETIKVRLGDLEVAAAQAGATAAGAGGGDRLAVRGTPRRVLDNVATIRTLAMVQIPEDAYLIVEGETPGEHTVDVAIALVLLVFASVNLVGLAKGLRR